MNIYTFNNTDRDDDGFYDLFKKTVVNETDISYDYVEIQRSVEYRPDLLSKSLYGSDEYVEEILAMNNIINPFAIKSGSFIFKAFNVANLESMYKRDTDVNAEIKNKILNVNKNKTSSSTNYPPTVRPGNLKQLDVNYNNKKITIINKFK